MSRFFYFLELQGCPPIDLGLILDSSGSLNFGDNEQKIQEFAKALIDKFDVNPGVNGTHVSIVQFDNEATLLLGFNDLQTKANVESNIDSYEVRDGQTFLNRAIDLANEQFEESKGMRGRGYRKVRIILRVTSLHCMLHVFASNIRLVLLLFFS